MPQQGLPNEGNHTIPVSLVLGQDPAVVTAPSTEKGKPKGRSKSKKGRANPPRWQAVAPVTLDAANPATPIRNGVVTVTGTPVVRQPSPVTPIGGSGNGPEVHYSTPQVMPREAQAQQGECQQAHTPGMMSGVEQELVSIAGRAAARDNAI